MAQKQHIELRSPQMCVAILGLSQAVRRITVKFEVEPMEVEGGVFNGCYMELTREQAVAHVRQMNRSIAMFDRDQKQEDLADLDARYK